MNYYRIKLISIFKDTLEFIANNKILKEAVSYSINHTKIYLDGYKFDKVVNPQYLSKIEVSSRRSFEAAIKIKKENPNYKVGVLNFASANNPGGGVDHGSGAQEESLCRCSTLYPCLNNQYCLENFYEKHRKENDGLNNDDTIYTPDILIIKSDITYPVRLLEEDFIKVDVLTCAAPNLREEVNERFDPGGVVAPNTSDDELYKIHLKRAKHIFEVAIDNQIDVLILGAFGCGAFRNNPSVVAKAYKDALKEYQGYFKVIEFAIYHRKYELDNYQAFFDIFNK